MKIIEYFSVKNDCYKNNQKRIDSRYRKFQDEGPKGIILHSIGCPQPKAEVLAKNWNAPGGNVAVHAALQEDGTVYQCLPWNYRGWHAGGSANNTHIGVEMSEPECIKYIKGSSFSCSDKERAIEQVTGTYKTAVELFAYLCGKYDLDPMKDIISHEEAYRKGIGSNHGDPVHLWRQLGLSYTMDGFRKDVANSMGKVLVTNSNSSFLVKVLADSLNIRTGPGTSYKVVGSIDDNGTYTIVEEKNGWGKLKSGLGWISIKPKYAKRV